MELERQTMEAAQLEKLQLEIKQLKNDLNGNLSQRLATWSPVISSVIAVGGFLFGIHSYFANQKVEHERQIAAQQAEAASHAAAQEKEERARAAARDMDARRSLWEKQLTLYFEASNATATIATTTDDEARKKAIESFWRLYWGPLAVVEDKALLVADDAFVEKQMVVFGQALNRGAANRELQQESLTLAKKIAESIDLVWSTKEAAKKNTYKTVAK